jgi:hypothetical protein|tara:strand:- start:321 stop:902 length:582 start_codon:yes stop_codon:yes gene_type:complete
MANQNAPFGLRPIGKIGQNRDNQGLSEYSIKANDTTSIFFQDVVNATADGTVHLGAASEAFMVGSLNGVFYTDPTTSKPTFRNNYAQVNASDIVAFVADDPYERFEIQSDNTLASAQTDVFNNFNLNVNPTTPSAANNVSTTQLDDSTVTTGTAQVKVTGVSTDIKNNDLSASHVNFVVMINEHLYNAKNNGI